MKFLTVAIALVATGCFGTTYSSTKVGPDRFAVTAHGNDNGAESYTTMLQQAYETCVQAGFRDYQIVSNAREQRKQIVYVRCTEQQHNREREQAANGKENNDGKESTVMSDLERWYEDAKRKIEKRMKEAQE